MRTPQDLERRLGLNDRPALTDVEIEARADERIEAATIGQMIVYVSFDDAASALRCVDLYSKHWTCRVDGRGFTVEIEVPTNKSRIHRRTCGTT